MTDNNSILWTTQIKMGISGKQHADRCGRGYKNNGQCRKQSSGHNDDQQNSNMRYKSLIVTYSHVNKTEKDVFIWDILLCFVDTVIYISWCIYSIHILLRYKRVHSFEMVRYAVHLLNRKYIISAEMHIYSQGDQKSSFIT